MSADSLPAPAGPAPSPAWPEFRRRPSGRLVAGVATGLAEHLDRPVHHVRAVLCLLALVTGAGIAAYALLWLFTGVAEEERPTPAPAREKGRAFGMVAGTAVISTAAWPIVSKVVSWPVVALVLVGTGAALLWRQFDRPLGEVFRPRTVGAWARTIGGVLLVVLGLAVVVGSRVSIGELGSSLVVVVITVIGIGLLTVPLWMRLWQTLAEERTAVIRAAEREDIASHLHDSVLQTLALIQKRADRPQEVHALARRQERELRQWLFGTTAHTSAGAATFRAALDLACAEVEDAYGLRVSAVVVGPEVEVDERVAAVLGAAREALVNVAKHAGVETADVFAECDAGTLAVFVRDRGCGFDVDAVPADRHGLEQSVRRRVESRGGTVRVDSRPGEGTEISIELPPEGAE